VISRWPQGALAYYGRALGRRLGVQEVKVILGASGGAPRGASEPPIGFWRLFGALGRLGGLGGAWSLRGPSGRPWESSRARVRLAAFGKPSEAGPWDPHGSLRFPPVLLIVFYIRPPVPSGSPYCILHKASGSLRFPPVLLAPPGSSWLLLAPPGSSWPDFFVIGSFWLLLARFFRDWLLLALLAPPGSSWVPLALPGQIFS
jgi:hypothetical protein